MQGIFVSYRRQDSQSAAGRLSDHLRDHLEQVPIFRDVETIEPGADFVDAIEHALQACAVLLAVIGPQWLSVVGETGGRRLDDPADYTRIEIATALKRPGVRVIPVLVEGAGMPPAEALPGDLAELARRNAVELSDKRWEYDVGQLVATLRRILAIPEPRPVPPPPPEPGGSYSKRWWIAAGLGVLLVGGYLADQQDEVWMPEPSAVDSPAMRDMPQIDYAAAPTPAAALPAPAGTMRPLTGLWHDTEGGQIEIVQQGQQLVFQGMGEDGYVAGRALLNGNRGEGTHTLNGYLLHSSFVVSSDGSRIDVVILDPGTGQRHAIVLLRAD